MAERLEIEGGLIRRVRIETIAEAPLESLSAHLVRRIATTFPVMPSHPVRFMAFDGETNRGVFIVEQAPGLRHIRVQHRRGSQYTDDATRGGEMEAGVWRVQFPWQYFVFAFNHDVRGTSLVNFTIDGTSLYWARESLRSGDHQLFPAPVPNVDTMGGICWGNTRADNSSLSARIDDYINNFTTTTFNEDLGHFTPFNHSLTEWERNSSEANPLSWTTWDVWNQTNATTPSQLAEGMNPGSLQNLAEINPAWVDLPTPPENFTIARAREYLDSLSPSAQRRFIAAAHELILDNDAEPIDNAMEAETFVTEEVPA